MDEKDVRLVFSFFNEVGILEQLSRAAFEARLPEGFLVSHFAVLNHLIRVRDGQTPLVIARAFQVPKTTMTHTLQGLEKAGLVEMRPNPDDGRSKCVWLTEAGRRFREGAIQRMVPAFAEILADVPAERFAEALPFLTEMRERLDRARD